MKTLLKLRLLSSVTNALNDVLVVPRQRTSARGLEGQRPCVQSSPLPLALATMSSEGPIGLRNVQLTVNSFTGLALLRTSACFRG